MCLNNLYIPERCFTAASDPVHEFLSVTQCNTECQQSYMASSFWVVVAPATRKHLKFNALKSTEDPKFCDMVRVSLDDSGPYL